jgi:hypothetical protein
MLVLPLRAFWKKGIPVLNPVCAKERLQRLQIGFQTSKLELFITNNLQ